MTKFLPHHRYALAGLLFCIVVSVSILATPYLAGADLNLDKPLAHLARLLAALSQGGPPLERSALMLELFQAAQVAVVGLHLWLYWVAAGPGAEHAGWRSHAAIVVQGMAGVLLDSLALNLLCAAQLGALVPWRRARFWLAALYLAGPAGDMLLIAVSWIERDSAVEYAIMAYNGLERLVLLLAFGLAMLVRAEQRGRAALAAANAELSATQALLGDTVRASERMRIARDLHDATGHHLTALKLHLDLAQRQSEGKASASLATANRLASDLLAEVRAVISTERRDEAINLRAALESLCAGIPHPEIRLQIDQAVRIRSAGAAHTLFNCVREAVTNAVRHADAGVVTITLRMHDDQVLLSVADDGRGSSGSEGNGLRGMRERLEQQGGSLNAATLPQGGFGLDIAMPSAGALA